MPYAHTHDIADMTHLIHCVLSYSTRSGSYIGPTHTHLLHYNHILTNWAREHEPNEMQHDKCRRRTEVMRYQYKYS